MGWFAEGLSSILLFGLVFGMSATVQFKQLRKQIGNHTALLLGVGMQFLILPFVGFIIVNILSLPAPMGITLLVITSSPGGSYSNWWCSMFNAELSLSVCMTALSTLLSTVMLPANLILYTQWTYSSAVVESLDWHALMVSLIVVISAISLGLAFSAYYSLWVGGVEAIQFRKRANKLGNAAGLSLVLVSATVSSSNQKASLWDQDPAFYIGVALPALTGLALAAYLSVKAQLEKPECVAVSVEACYQNTGIATSVALTMFDGQGEDLATAIGVPLYYGIVEACALGVFCLICWKLGWTKAPPDENLCVALAKSYEIEEHVECSENVAIEVVLSGENYEQQSPRIPSSSGGGREGGGGGTPDLIFAQSQDGTYVVDQETLNIVQGKNKGSDSSTEDSFEPVEDDQVEDIPLGNNTPTSRSSSRGYAAAPTRSPLQDGASPSGAISENSESSTSSRWRRTLATLRARANGYRTGQHPGSPQHPAPYYEDNNEEYVEGQAVAGPRRRTLVPTGNEADVEESHAGGFSTYGDGRIPMEETEI